MSKLTQGEIDALFAQYSSGEEQLEPAAAAPMAVASPATVPLAAPALAEFAVLPQLEAEPVAAALANPIALLANVDVEITVRLGQARRSIREVLSLTPGSVLELDGQAGEAVDILVNGQLLARGEVVIVGENFGVRITQMVQANGGRFA